MGIGEQFEFEKTGRIEPENSRPVDSFVKLPRKLTAENGAKALLIGEFVEHVSRTCPECAGEGCEDCKGIGGWSDPVPVSWTTIKEIYKKIVEHMAI